MAEPIISGGQGEPEQAEEPQSPPDYLTATQLVAALDPVLAITEVAFTTADGQMLHFTLSRPLDFQIEPVRSGQREPYSALRNHLIAQVWSAIDAQARAVGACLWYATPGASPLKTEAEPGRQPDPK